MASGTISYADVADKTAEASTRAEEDVNVIRTRAEIRLSAAEVSADHGQPVDVSDLRSEVLNSSSSSMESVDVWRNQAENSRVSGVRTDELDVSLEIVEAFEEHGSERSGVLETNPTPGLELSITRDEYEINVGVIRTAAEAFGSTSSSTIDPKKNWSKRPPNWMIIAEEAGASGNAETLLKYRADFGGMSDAAAYRRLYKWKKDVINKKPPSYTTRMPSYGKVIDDKLLRDFHVAQAAGLSVSDDALRQYLIQHLAAAGLEHLLVEKGGKNTFGASWAARFCKRHNVGPRQRAARGTKVVHNRVTAEKLSQCRESSVVAEVLQIPPSQVKEEYELTSNSGTESDSEAPQISI